MTYHGLTKEIYRDKDIWRNLVLDARISSTVNRSLDK
jgi:hypothetical protein